MAAEEGGEQQQRPPRAPPGQCCNNSGLCGTRVEEALQLRLDVGDSSFDLEKAVCSHGLFMMAPNSWDPLSRTFQRPLRLCSPSSVLSVDIRVSHPHPRPSPLHISVFGASSLSDEHRQALLMQVRRMLRVSDEDRRMVEGFHRMHPAAKERGFGRVFRSPTLFEDMVKCILLCNCQWPRTLSMARALCELQLELKGSASDNFQPTTPQQKELKRQRRCKGKFITTLEFVGNESGASACRNTFINNHHSPQYPGRQNPESCDSSILNNAYDGSEALEIINAKNLSTVCQGTVQPCLCKVGNFPSPEELASLDENFLAKRCGLGYRAKRILALAQGIVQSMIRLEEFEEVCDTSKLSSYARLNERLSNLDGFGPFTCANVLVCMGFYHRIPADSETIRHLKLFHSRRCTIQAIEKHVEDIYGEYAPFQFLAYWSELWDFYEQRFERLSEMAPSNYRLITASNMKNASAAKKRKTIRS